MNTGTAYLKKERVQARVTPEQKELFQRAADLTGRSISDFIVSSAQAAAENAIRTHQVIQLTAGETAAFVDAFLNPQGPNETMRKYMRKHKELLGKTQ